MLLYCVFLRREERGERGGGRLILRINHLLEFFVVLGLILSLVAIRTVGSPGVGEYDPLADVNGDGVIDIFDITKVALAFGATGTPINETAWLEMNATLTEVLAKIDELNVSIATLELSLDSSQLETRVILDALNTSFIGLQNDVSTLDTRLASLNASLLQLQLDLSNMNTVMQTFGIRLDSLNASLTSLEARVSTLEALGFTNEPTYDSGWMNITNKCGQYFTLAHNLNSTNLLIDIAGKVGADSGVHKRYLGGTNYVTGLSKTYGGASDDNPRSVIQTSDGGYALVGWTYSYGAGSCDFWLVKTDSTGSLQWNKTYGGASIDNAYSVVQAGDGGYVLAGRTYSFGAGLSDFWLVKTDSSGNMLWNRTYGGTKDDWGFQVIQSNDGGYAIVGYTNSFSASYDSWLVKTDSAGNMQWNKTYGGANSDYTYSVVQSSDGGYAIGGHTNSFGAGNYDFWLVKIDSTGSLQWSKTYGGTNVDNALSLIRTSDNGYALIGETLSFGAGNYDFWLVKTDSVGNLQWSKTYGGVNSDSGYSLVQTVDGGYAIAGRTNSFGSNYDFWLVKTDLLGNMNWNKTYDRGSNDYAYSLIQTREGGYILAGETYPVSGTVSSDFWLIKTDAEQGLAMTDSTADTLSLYRGITDAYWNFIRVRIWRIEETP